MKKFLISLLVGMILTGTFLVLGQIGFIDNIETTFYGSQILQRVDDDLSRVHTAFEDYQSNVLTEFQEIIYSPAFRKSYAVNQISEDISARREQILTFAQNHPSFISLRFFDENFTRIHYSSKLSDIESQRPTGIVYYPVEDISLSVSPEIHLNPEQLQGPGDWQLLIIDHLQFLVYFFPLYNEFNIFEGWGMLETDLSSFENILIQEQLISYGEQIYLLNPNGLLLNGPQQTDELIPELKERWDLLQDNENVTLNIEGSGETLIRIQPGNKITLAYLIPLSRLRLTPVMKGFLAVMVFFTTILLLHLLLNLRQDSEVVIRDRIKRFQLELLQQTVDQQGNIDINKWQSEWRFRKTDLKKRILSGIAFRDKKIYDELIDISWDEILDVLGNRQTSNHIASTTSINIANLEQLVEQLATRITNVASPATKRELVSPTSTGHETDSLPVNAENINSLEGAEVEELEDVEVEELEELEVLESAEIEIPEEVGKNKKVKENINPVKISDIPAQQSENPIDNPPVNAENINSLEGAEVEELEDVGVEELEELEVLESAEIEIPEEVGKNKKVKENINPVKISDIPAQQSENPIDNPPVNAENINSLEGAEVEELEELEELEDVEVGELEDVEVGELEDVEVGELEDVEVGELEDVEVGELEDVEVGELEDVEVGELEDVEVGELEDVEVGELEDVEVGELEDVEVGELEDVEVGELEDVEVGELEDVEVGELEDVEVGELEDVEVGELEELEVLESAEIEISEEVGENKKIKKNKDPVNIVMKQEISESATALPPIKEILPDLLLNIPDIVEIDLELSHEEHSNFILKGNPATSRQDDLDILDAIPLVTFKGLSSLVGMQYKFMGSSEEPIRLNTAMNKPTNNRLSLNETANQNRSDTPVNVKDLGRIEFSVKNTTTPQSISIIDVYNVLKNEIVQNRESGPHISSDILRHQIPQKNDDLSRLISQVVRGEQKFSNTITMGVGDDSDQISASAEKRRNDAENHNYSDKDSLESILSLTGQEIVFSGYEQMHPSHKHNELTALTRISVEMKAPVVLFIEISQNVAQYIGSVGLTDDVINNLSQKDVEQILSVNKNMAVEYFESNIIDEYFPVFSPLAQQIHAVLFLPCTYHNKSAMLVIGLLEKIDDLKQFCIQHFKI